MDVKEKFHYLWQNLAQSDEETCETVALKFIEFFCDLLKVQMVSCEQQDGFCASYLDMSSIQMKVTEETPFFITKIKSDDKHQVNELFLRIKNRLFEFNHQDQVAFIFVIGETDYFKSLCEDSLLDLVVLDKKSVGHIVESQKPRSTFIKVCKEQISIQRLSPYEVIDPVVGGMFYGRKKEMQQIVTRGDTNFVITGCRKIGKSSLILNAFNLMCEDGSTMPIFVDCYPYKTAEEFVNQVVTRLDIRELRRMTVDKFHDFLRRMNKRHKKRITFVMDEVDGLLANDKDGGWQLFNILCSAHAYGYCRFIITGYREVFEAALNLNSPIYRFLDPIRIHDIDDESATALITQPIRDMAILFREPVKIRNRILEQTSRQPNLIQFICKKLVEIVGKRNANEIKYDDLVEVENSPEYRHYIADTFLLNSNELERLTVYCMLNYSEFSQKEIDEELGHRKISLKLNKLERLCSILEMGNVLLKVGKKYRFSNLALPGILKEDSDPDYVIKKLVNEVKSRW